MIESLAQLFAPETPAAIVAARRARKPLHIRGTDAGRFAALAPIDTLATRVTAEHLLEGSVRAMRDGRAIPLEMLTSAEAPGRPRRTDPLLIQQLAAQGFSLIFNDLASLLPRVSAVTAMLERSFGGRSGANAYLSMTRDGALAPHYDDHDVLVLQCEGSKRWFGYGQPWRDPVSWLPGFAFPADPGPATWEALLAPGDLLFVPRGEVHRAAVEGSRSLHLAVSLVADTGAVLLEAALERALSDPHARAGHDRAAPAPERAAHAQALRELLRTVADAFDADSLLAAADAARPPAPALDLGFALALEGEPVVQPALRRRIAIPEGGDFEIAGLRLRLSPDEARVLGWLVANDSGRPSAIAAALDMTAVETRDAVAGLARHALVFVFPDHG